MPTVEIFDGIKIEMYVNDRNPPHVHIKYAKHKCILEIQMGNIYAGNLPLRQMKKAISYVVNHQELLLTLWNQLNRH